MLPVCFQDKFPEAGCDEAGRGCLAGPVFAAAVILPPDFRLSGLNDSKQVPEKRRKELREAIERDAVAWAVASVDPARIDVINILYASFEAMNMAVSCLATKPGFLLIDGNRFRCSTDIPYKCIVGGDGRYANIAAASILAKTHRDEYMERISEEFPVYGWERNKGYPTIEHRRAIMEYGLCVHHRRSFRNPAGQLSLFSEE